MTTGVKKTQEEFVEEAVNVHGEKYTYELTNYVGLKSKVDITCLKHGLFSIGAGKLLIGQGCQKCAAERPSKSRHCIEDFIGLSKRVHGSKYDYSRVVLKTDSDLIEIICPKHESFWQKPSVHKQGRGCQKCAREVTGNARRLDTAQFVANATKEHGTKYDYSRVHYEDSKTKVEIICPDHEPFWLSPSKHTDGRGCPKCSWNGAGYSQTKPGTFYILKYDNVTKVGITNRAVSERIKGINRYSEMDFTLYSSVYSEDGGKARNIELQVLAWLKLHYKNVETKFDGYTECFLDVDIDALMNFVVPIS